MKVKISLSINGEFELNQKILCADRSSKGRISRIDLGIKLNLSENTKKRKSMDKKVTYACQYLHLYHRYFSLSSQISLTSQNVA